MRLSGNRYVFENINSVKSYVWNVCGGIISADDFAAGLLVLSYSVGSNGGFTLTWFAETDKNLEIELQPPISLSGWLGDVAEYVAQTW